MGAGDKANSNKWCSWMKSIRESCNFCGIFCYIKIVTPKANSFFCCISLRRQVVLWVSGNDLENNVWMLLRKHSIVISSPVLPSSRADPLFIAEYILVKHGIGWWLQLEPLTVTISPQSMLCHVLIVMTRSWLIPHSCPLSHICSWKYMLYENKPHNKEVPGWPCQAP